MGLSIDPRDRYPDMRTLVRELGKLLESSGSKVALGESSTARASGAASGNPAYVLLDNHSVLRLDDGGWQTIWAQGHIHALALDGDGTLHVFDNTGVHPLSSDAMWTLLAFEGGSVSEDHRYMVEGMRRFALGRDGDLWFADGAGEPGLVLVRRDDRRSDDTHDLQLAAQLARLVDAPVIFERHRTLARARPCRGHQLHAGTTRVRLPVEPEQRHVHGLARPGVVVLVLVEPTLTVAAPHCRRLFTQLEPPEPARVGHDRSVVDLEHRGGVARRLRQRPKARLPHERANCRAAAWLAAAGVKWLVGRDDHHIARCWLCLPQRRRLARIARDKRQLPELQGSHRAGFTTVHAKFERLRDRTKLGHRPYEPALAEQLPGHVKVLLGSAWIRKVSRHDQVLASALEHIGLSRDAALTQASVEIVAQQLGVLDRRFAR
jgi:hypothetical protein